MSFPDSSAMNDRTSHSEPEEDAFLLEKLAAKGRGRTRRQAFLTCSVVFIALILWTSSLVAVAQLSRRHCETNSFLRGFDTELEPIKSVLEVNKVRFTGGLEFDANGTLVSVEEEGATRYAGEPTPEMDAAWDRLLEADGVDLRGPDAAAVAGRTFQKEGGWWLVGVDVFHQIHCLNMVRQALRPDYYPPRDPEPVHSRHVYHCLDYVRQAIMCNVDVTWIPTYWDQGAGRIMADFQTEHTCRDFDKVRDWTVARSGLRHPAVPIGGGGE